MCWSEEYQRNFFQNHDTQETTWEDPREAPGFLMAMLLYKCQFMQWKVYPCTPRRKSHRKPPCHQDGKHAGLRSTSATSTKITKHKRPPGTTPERCTPYAYISTHRVAHPP